MRIKGWDMDASKTTRDTVRFNFVDAVLEQNTAVHETETAGWVSGSLTSEGPVLP